MANGVYIKQIPISLGTAFLFAVLITGTIIPQVTIANDDEPQLSQVDNPLQSNLATQREIKDAAFRQMQRQYFEHLKTRQDMRDIEMEKETVIRLARSSRLVESQMELAKNKVVEEIIGDPVLRREYIQNAPSQGSTLFKNAVASVAQKVFAKAGVSSLTFTAVKKMLASNSLNDDFFSRVFEYGVNTPEAKAFRRVLEREIQVSPNQSTPFRHMFLVPENGAEEGGQSIEPTLLEKTLQDLSEDNLNCLRSSSSTQEEKRKALGLDKPEDLKRLVDSLITLPDQEEVTSLSIEEQRIQHAAYVQQRMSDINSTAQIIALFNPELAQTVHDGATAMLQAFDGLKGLNLNGLNIADIGSLSGAIRLGVSLLGKSGPTADEVIMDLLGDVLRNQQEIIKSLSRIEGKIDRLSNDMAYLLEFSKMSHEEVMGKLSEIQQKLETIDNRIIGLRQYVQQLHLEDITSGLDMKNDNFKTAFANPHSSVRKLLEKPESDRTVSEQMTLNNKYEQLEDHLQKIVSYATNKRVIKSQIFTVPNKFLSTTSDSLENEMGNLSPEYRASLLPEIAQWLAMEKFRLQLKDMPFIDQDKFEDICNPALFSEIFVPTFVDAAQWHRNREIVHAQAEKLRAQFYKISIASVEARNALPLALAVYQTHATTMEEYLKDYIESIPPYSVIKEYGPGKDIGHEAVKKILNGRSQNQIIELGRDLGLWTIEEHTQLVTKAFTRFYQLHDPKELLRDSQDPRAPGDIRRLKTADEIMEMVKHNGSKNIQQTGVSWIIKETEYAQKTYSQINHALPIGTNDPVFRRKYHYLTYEQNEQDFLEERHRATGNIPVGVVTLREDGRRWVTVAGQLPRTEEVAWDANVCAALHDVIASELLKKANQGLKTWKGYTQEGGKVKPLVEKLSRSRFAVETLIKVGYGDCDGASPDFNPLYQLLQSMPPVYLPGGTANVRDFDDLMTLLRGLPSSKQVATPDKMPQFPSPEEVDYCDYGWGDQKDTAMRLNLLP